MLPQLFARRYLFSSQSRSVVNLISGLSVAAVAMPVAAMIILLSVFNGFESLVKSMYSAFDADLTVSPRQGQTFAQRDLDTAALARIPGVGALSFTLEQSALLEHGGRQATATIRGVDDAYGAVFQLGDAVSAGEWRVRLGDLERLVVGQSMAWMLGIRSLADADVTLYAVRRGSFSSLLPLENYTRRTEPVGGVYTLDLETERTYVLASLRLAQELQRRKFVTFRLCLLLRRLRLFRRRLDAGGLEKRTGLGLRLREGNRFGFRSRSRLQNGLHVFFRLGFRFRLRLRFRHGCGRGFRAEAHSGLCRGGSGFFILPVPWRNG